MSGPTPAQRAAALDLCLAAETFDLTVRTGCMAPRIPAGARVRVRRCNAEALRAGDVALLRRGDRLFLHRVLGRARADGGPALLCRADNRRRPDPPWPFAAAAGCATHVADSAGGAFRPLRGGAGRRIASALAGRAFALAAAAGLRPWVRLEPPDRIAEAEPLREPAGETACRVGKDGADPASSAGSTP